MTGQLPSGWTITPPASQDALPPGWTITAPDAAAPQPEGMGMKDMAVQAGKNLPSSALEFGKNMIYPFLHPIDTANAMKDVGLGALQKIRNLSPPDLRGSAPPFDTSAIDAVGQHFQERYGGGENIKGTIAKDPVGALADASLALTGGATLPARVPGVVGKVGQIAQTAGRVADPVNIASRAVGATAPLVTHTLGTLTGAGPIAIREAYQAGRTGGDTAKAFLDQLRGDAPTDVVAQTARDAVDKLRMDRGNAYRSDMSAITRDPSVLDFKPISEAVDSIASAGTYKGKIINEKAAGTWGDINKAVDDWRNSDPAQFHTVEGLDALKKKIGDIRDSTEFGTPSRKVADQVYNTIRDQIVSQAPAYGKTMKAYEEASSVLNELDRALSLNERSGVDTAIRKLQSIMRNNANTNYGRRVELGRTLEGQGGADMLFPQLAGQMLSSWAPRGLQQHAATVGGIGAMMTNPLYLAGLPLMSPRAVGNAAFNLGASSGGATPAARAAGEFLDPYSLRMGAYGAGLLGNEAQSSRGLFGR